MIKICSLLFRCYIFVLIVHLVSACTENKETSPIACFKDCLQFQSSMFNVHFNTDIVLVEELYLITFTSKVKITEAFVTGVNMDMGKLPLKLELIQNEEDNYIYQTNFLLGLCSDPKMNWQLTVQSKSSNSNFEFVSYWKRPTH